VCPEALTLLGGPEESASHEFFGDFGFEDVAMMAEGVVEVSGR
jgi:hypothetical protein